MAAVDRRRADRQVVAVADITQQRLDFGRRAVGVEQGRYFLGEFAALAAQLESLRVVVRNQHQRHVRVSRDIFAELQQIAVDLGLLLGRIVGLLHAEAHEACEVIEDVARQEDFRTLSQ